MSLSDLSISRGSFSFPESCFSSPDMGRCCPSKKSFMKFVTFLGYLFCGIIVGTLLGGFMTILGSVKLHKCYTYQFEYDSSNATSSDCYNITNIQISTNNGRISGSFDAYVRETGKQSTFKFTQVMTSNFSYDEDKQIECSVSVYKTKSVENECFLYCGNDYMCNQNCVSGEGGAFCDAKVYWILAIVFGCIMYAGFIGLAIYLFFSFGRD